MHAVCSLWFLSCLRSQNSITAWNITYHCRSLQIKAISSLRLLPIYCYSPKEAVLKLYIVTFPIWRRRGCTWTQNQLKIYTLLSFPSETWGGRHGHTKSIKKKNLPYLNSSGKNWVLTWDTFFNSLKEGTLQFFHFRSPLFCHSLQQTKECVKRTLFQHR